MSITVGPLQDDAELEALAAEHRRTYLWSDEEQAAWLADRRADALNVRVVRRDGKVAGGLTLIPMGQFFGGRSVPMTGIGSVGIDPQERATGLASALMRAAVEELHASGAALSALFPATQPVYRRVGYEQAGSFMTYSLPVNTIDVRDRSLQVGLCDPVDRDLLVGLYETRARQSNGLLDRAPGMWDRILERPNTDMHTYLVSGEDGAEGYVVFSQTRHEGWKYNLNVRDIVALTAASARRLLTFFADHRSFANDLKWNGGPAEPLIYHLREQDWNVERPWNWMLRIIDVSRALNERGYPAGVEGELHLEVTDDILAPNEGRLVLEVSGGKGQIRTGGDGGLKVDIRGLSPLYTGFLGAEELRTTGYVQGSDRDLATATAIFAGPAPWLADFF